MDALWKPKSPDTSAMAEFIKDVNFKFNIELSNYHELWCWSVDHHEEFWRHWWDYSNPLASSQPTKTLVQSESFERSKWFPDAELNFAQNLLQYRDQKGAIVFRDEDGNRKSISYSELYNIAGSVAAELKKLGVSKGDRVAAIMPNLPETIIAMLATTWLGAIWSSCSPDFGVDGVLERFEQIRPKILIACDGYKFKGKTFSILDKVNTIQERLNCKTILVSWQSCGRLPSTIPWEKLSASNSDFPSFCQVKFNDPVYILYSSGTTGRPKCIVHGVGGTLLQHLKEHRLHTDISREDIMFYFTTCGWMMWNWLASGLASGCTILLYEGNPFFPSEDTLLRIAEEENVTVFGTSAKYISAIEKAGLKPKAQFNFNALKTILSTGSPLLPESYDYVYKQIKYDVQLSSISGGTDIVSCFTLGCPLLPVNKGEIQCRGLGMAVEVWDIKGNKIQNQPGELVCTKTFPSKPIYFWKDYNGEKFHQAYFKKFKGVWCHGDWATLTSSNGLIITGRSDAVLNPGGVRIGTAEIYRQVEKIPTVLESIAVGQRWLDDLRIILFVVLRHNENLTEGLSKKIRQTLQNNASPRHVPAKIIQVEDIPRTRSGKISEISVRNIIHGEPIANIEAIANPEAFEHFKNRKELLS